MKPEHPEMQSLKAQIDELDRQIAREAAQMSSGRTNTLLADYRAAVSAERALQARVRQLKGDVLNLRGRSIQYNILQREVDTNRSLYDALLQRYKEIGVAGGIGIAPVSIVDRADAPGLPYKPNLFTEPAASASASACLPELRARSASNSSTTRSRAARMSASKLALPCLGVGPEDSGARTRSSRI